MRKKIHAIIGTVRKIVKTFRKSPKKNDKLQSYANATLGHELQLSLDVKSRWNSMVDMVRTYLRIKDQVYKATIDFKLKINLTDDDLNVLKDLVSALYSFAKSLKNEFLHMGLIYR